MKPPPMESRRVVGIPHLSMACRRIAAAFVILHSSFVIAADAPTNPTRTELWVPTKQLDLILQKHPKAVLLNREQYETLIRDAAKTKPVEDPKLAAPKELIIEGLKLRGKAEPGATRITLTGELTLNVPADSWSQKMIEWPFHLDISQVTSDGTILAWLANEEFTASNIPAETMRRLNIAARGPGRRVLRFTCILPLYYRLRSGERGLDLQYTGCGGQIELELPPGAALLPGSAARHEGQRVTAAFDHRFIRRSDNGDPLTSIPPNKRTSGSVLMDACRIRWIESPGTLPQDALRFENSGSARFSISDSSVFTHLQFLTHVRQSTTGQHEAVWPILGTDNTQVTEVTGPDVLKWEQHGQKLHVTLQQSSSLAPVDVQMSQSLTLDAASSVTLPSLSVPVLLPASYTIGEGLDLLSLDTTNDNFIRLDREPPQLKLRIAKPRIETDVDVLARIDKDSVQIERKLMLRSDRPATELKITLPAGEEFIAILSKPVGSGQTVGTSNTSTLVANSAAVVTPNNISQPIFSDRVITSNVVSNTTGNASPFRLTWRRVGQTISILPAQPISPANSLEFSITSRLKLAKAWNGPRNPETVTIRHLDIPDAVKVAGYTALDFDDAWRVALKATTGLEDRDARLTPVKGRMAWFGLREHALSFEVERAEAVFSTEVIAYALPRARTIEIEGQFALDISGAPLRSFQVKLPIDAAKLLRVTSPLIGEQQLDEKTGIWTLTLRQESKGHQNIRFRLSLPAEQKEQSRGREGDGPEVVAPKPAITATLPRIELPQSRRFAGTWVIEANTDTQLSTQAQSMQPLDVLRAPAMADYQPRHRITSAFTYGAAEHALTITARRHAHSELAALVVTQMQLRSVLDADGHSLHEAHLTLTHSGEQFIALTLPPAAELLSTLANRQAVKPVRSVGDAIAIPLPAGSANEPDTTVTIQYRLTTAPWNSRGELALTPITLAPNIPILTTDWQVHTPPNFGYDKVKTTLEQESHRDVPGIVPQTLSMLADAAGSYSYPYELTKMEKQVDFLPGGSSGSTNFGFAMAAAPAQESAAATSAPATNTERRSQVEKGLLLANSNIEIGNYDAGIAQYQDVLRTDPYNSAARRGMETAERKRMEFKTTYDHQRAKMLAQVDAQWEDKVPTNVTPLALASGSTRSAGAYLTDKMDKIIFPSVQFQNATVAQAIEFLRAKSKELDTIETDPSRKGINIILRGSDAPASASISLELKNIPMSEALRYITDLAQMKYKVESYAVVVVPISDNNTEMFTRSYKVAPDVLARLAEDKDSGAAAGDPFAANLPASPDAKKKAQPSARDLLIEQGISFPEGATASYDAASSTIVVRNTAANLDLTESLVEEGDKKAFKKSASKSKGGRLQASVDEMLFDNGKSGLIPLDVTMPVTGRMLRFHGHQAPEPLVLQYRSWEHQMAWAVLAMLVGMLAFARFAWRRPWVMTLLVLVLAAWGFPLVFEGQALAYLNAATFGWLCALTLCVLLSVMRYGTSLRQKYAPSTMQEATV